MSFGGSGRNTERKLKDKGDLARDDTAVCSVKSTDIHIHTHVIDASLESAAGILPEMRLKAMSKYLHTAEFTSDNSRS